MKTRVMSKSINVSVDEDIEPDFNLFVVISIASVILLSAFSIVCMCNSLLMSGRMNNIFNNSDIDKRAHMIYTYGQYLDYIFEPGYVFHFYCLGSNIVMLQYSTDQEIVVDIWMLEYNEFDNFVAYVNIDDIWERVKR